MVTSNYNFYEVLEINANAPQHEVTKAYERAKSTYSGNNPAVYTIFSEFEARELMKMIEEAYSVLGNKTLRALYDEKLLSGTASPSDLTYNALLSISKQNLPFLTVKEEVRPQYKRDPAYEKMIAEHQEWQGQDIKKIREYKNLTLEKMNEITKINPFYIKSIEDMDPSNLPAIVFIRGYVVQIAKALGLEEKRVADSYMKLFKQKNG